MIWLKWRINAIQISYPIFFIFWHGQFKPFIVNSTFFFIIEGLKSEKFIVGSLPADDLGAILETLCLNGDPEGLLEVRWPPQILKLDCIHPWREEPAIKKWKCSGEVKYRWE